MKTRKLLIISFALLMSFFIFTGCKSSQNENNDNQSTIVDEIDLLNEQPSYNKPAPDEEPVPPSPIGEGD